MPDQTERVLENIDWELKQGTKRVWVISSMTIEIQTEMKNAVADIIKQNNMKTVYRLRNDIERRYTYILSVEPMQAFVFKLQRDSDWDYEKELDNVRKYL